VNTVNHYALAPPASLHAESLEGQVALRIAARLNGGSEVLPHDITERLRFGRERALTVAFEQRRVAALAASPSHVGNTGMTALLAGPSAWWLRLASALPLAVLVAREQRPQIPYPVRGTNTIKYQTGRKEEFSIERI